MRLLQIQSAGDEFFILDNEVRSSMIFNLVNGHLLFFIGSILASTSRNNWWNLSSVNITVYF